MAWFFGITTFLLLTVCVFLIKRLYEILTIIAIFEDDISASIEAHAKAQESLDGILSLNLFFDSPEVRPVVQEAIEQIKISRYEITTCAERFVQRSNQKYVLYEGAEIPEENKSLQEQESDMLDQLTNKEFKILE